MGASRRIRIGSGVIGGEPLDPAPLSARFDRPGSVAAAGPGHGVGAGLPGQNDHAGDDRPRAAGATTAGHLDATAGPGEPVGPFNGGYGVVIVARDAKVGPVDPLRRPVGPPWLPSKSSATIRVRLAAEVKPEVGSRTVGHRLPSTSPADQRAVGQGDCPAERFDHAHILPPQRGRPPALVKLAAPPLASARLRRRRRSSGEMGDDG